MPIDVTWDNEAKTVLRYDIGEYWNWDDFPTAVRQAERMRAEVLHPVSLIIAAQDGMRPPLGFPLSSLIDRTLRAAPDSMSIAVFVGNDHFRNTMTFICRHLADNDGIATRLFVTATLEKARTIIAQRHQTYDTQMAQALSEV
jgi:hypothetical protein